MRGASPRSEPVGRRDPVEKLPRSALGDREDEVYERLLGGRLVQRARVDGLVAPPGTASSTASAADTSPPSLPSRAT